ncbi:AzlD domain-containing protein [Cellulosilyticum lentocellum]|uniref:Branched-chain amino acid transport n=1 Tax=Cellulosilyticum lentocellum (strain ATCC 49066 / DSM 5427 / NCIMB 11756 / RHM5) TaxID=642492 RepID=F2JJV3_CELLD|nr:AzlD domain-containing protein [Cellulosilyticum lentocellum]ADZ83235.1 branched-chain amino acid transport [Cellulosilyticum lentocellum DSM 5427]
MDIQIVFILIGMSLVTYIPRVLPVMILDKMHISQKLEGILKAIPYAALGSLIFPSILSVNTNYPIIGIVGGCVAVILSYAKLNITYTICGTVAVTILIQLFFI